MRMRLEGVKKESLSVTPTQLTVAVAATPVVSVPVAIAVVVPATSEVAIGKLCAAVRAAPVPTSIACVMTIDKLCALLIKL